MPYVEARLFASIRQQARKARRLKEALLSRGRLPAPCRFKKAQQNKTRFAQTTRSKLLKHRVS